VIFIRDFAPSPQIMYTAFSSVKKNLKYTNMLSKGHFRSPHSHNRSKTTHSTSTRLLNSAKLQKQKGWYLWKPGRNFKY